MSVSRIPFDVNRLNLAFVRDQKLRTDFDHCSDYRELLRILFLAKKSLNPNFSFAMFANRSGFAARGFIKDVMTHKKRLTTRSLPKVIQGLDLTEDLAEYFYLMVAHQEHGIHLKDLTKAKISELMHKRHCSLKLALSQLSEPRPITLSPFRNRFAPRVYAALGDFDKGASLQEIRSRTRFSQIDLKTALAFLEENGFVEKLVKTGSYRVVTQDVYIQDRGAESAFKSYYVNLAKKKTAEAAKADFASLQQLFWLSHVSVKTKELPKLREELRSLLKRYVERIEDSQGDQVVDLCVNLT